MVASFEAVRPAAERIFLPSHRHPLKRFVRRPDCSRWWLKAFFLSAKVVTDLFFQWSMLVGPTVLPSPAQRSWIICFSFLSSSPGPTRISRRPWYWLWCFRSQPTWTRRPIVANFTCRIMRWAHSSQRSVFVFVWDENEGRHGHENHDCYPPNLCHLYYFHVYISIIIQMY